MAARTTVLDTVELLESILIYLPITNLLFSQRVSRHWRDVINSSISLQRALFFEPDKGGPLTLAVDEHHVKKYWVHINGDGEDRIVKNPLIEPLFRTIQAEGSDFSLGAGLPPAWRVGNASWRRMLPAQPSLRTSTYVGLWGLPEFWYAWYTEKITPLFSTEDVRMGQVFDELDAKHGRFPHGKKRIVIVGLD